MDDPKRICPQDAWHEIQGENGCYALLVYAPEAEEGWRRQRLKGSVSRAALESDAAGLAHDRMIIFYAASADDAAACDAARTWAERGYYNVSVLWGGYEAWKAAGYPAEP